MYVYMRERIGTLSVKDISDKQVVAAFHQAREEQYEQWPYEILASGTGQPEKVCYRAMERAERRGLVEYGVSLRTGWLTEAGLKLLQFQEN